MSDRKENAADIRCEDRDGYLYAFVSGGKDSLEISLEYWRRVVDECRERDYHKLLVEEDFPNQIDTMAMFEVARAVAEMPDRPLWIAFSDRQSTHDELNRFGETVAVNRGVTVRAFSSAEDAENWLKSE